MVVCLLLLCVMSFRFIQVSGFYVYLLIHSWFIDRLFKHLFIFIFSPPSPTCIVRYGTVENHIMWIGDDGGARMKLKNRSEIWGVRRGTLWAYEELCEFSGWVGVNVDVFHPTFIHLLRWWSENVKCESFKLGQRCTTYRKERKGVVGVKRKKMERRESEK